MSSLLTGLIMLSGFSFDRVVIVQSLEPHEVQTGVALSEYVIGLLQEYGYDIRVDLVRCSCALEFKEILQCLVEEATRSGAVPLLDVECHGDPKEGLIFENGSSMSWADVAAALLPLNRATRFNLLAIFSACFGAYFLQQMGVVKPAPCWCMVAPTESVDPGEVMRGIRAFYRPLIEAQNMDAAIFAVATSPLENGGWFCELAERWYETLIVSYIKNHCTEDVVRQRAKILFRKLKKSGVTSFGVGSIIRTLKAHNRGLLVRSYFESYFMLNSIPENRERFKGALLRTEKSVAKLRNSRLYVI